MNLKRNSILIASFAVISTLFLYFFSFSTSPLYGSFGFDSSIFMVVGKTLSSGKLLYAEIFDHKGPILFFIQSFGWIIGKYWGIFLLQVLNLTAILYFVYKISKLFNLSKWSFILPIIGLLSLLSFTNIEGNQSEEYSLLFLFIPSYFSIKYLLMEKGNQHPPRYAFIYGICFAIIAFNRITNAACIGGIVTGIFFFLIIKGEWKNMLLNIVFFFIGALCVIVPLFIYFSYHGTLSDMLYATFIFNYKYSKAVGQDLFQSLFIITRKDFFWFILKLSPIILLLMTSFSLYIKKKNLKLFLILSLISIFTYLGINMGLKAIHYLSINAIPLTIGIILLVSIIEDTKLRFNRSLKIFLATYTILMISYFIYQGRIIVHIYKETNCRIHETLGFNYYVDKELVDEIINKDEVNSVFGYNIPPSWYLKTDIIPPHKYFTNQENWIKSDSLVYNEINKYLISTPPKWIVIPEKRIMTWVVGIDSNPILKEMLEKDYNLEGSDINHKYYHRKKGL